MIRCHVFPPGSAVACDVPLDRALNPGEADCVWIDIEEPSSADLAMLTGHFQFHMLAVEDCTHLQKRAKFERYATHAFVVLCSLDRTTQEDLFDTVPICIFLRSRLVVTVHPKRVTAVERVANLLVNEPDRVGHHTERVLHTIVDAVIDEFLPLVEDREDLVDECEGRAAAEPTHELMEKLIGARRELLQMRRIILPHIEVLRRLVDPESPDVNPEYRVYFRDVLDHALVVSENVSLHLEVANGAISVVSHAVTERLNQVMKYLAAVSTMMLPLTVISGIFGMNFDIIPTSHAPWGFWGAIFMMFTCAAAFLAWFRWRGWIGSPRRPLPPPTSVPR